MQSSNQIYPDTLQKENNSLYSDDKNEHFITTVNILIM